MAVVILGIVQVVEPLLQLSPATYLHGRQLFQLLANDTKQRVLVIPLISFISYISFISFI